MPLILVLISLIAFSQEVELDAPWLTVYDPEGNPRWEVSLGRLYKTDSGWEGEGVEVRLYWEGELRFTLRADRLSADRLGRNWTLSGEVSGQAGELRISCRQADVILMENGRQNQVNSFHIKMLVLPSCLTLWKIMTRPWRSRKE